MRVIYKVLLPSEWAEFNDAGHFDGSPFDHESGFVHCSSREQVGATALRFFAGEPELVLVAPDSEQLKHVRWEPASGGELFPHVYGRLTGAAVVSVQEVAGAGAVEGALSPG